MRGIRHARDIQCAGQQDGRLKGAQFLDLHEANGLAVTIEHCSRCSDFLTIQVARMWEDCSDAGTQPPAPDGGVAHKDPCHVGDSVQRPERQ